MSYFVWSYSSVDERENIYPEWFKSKDEMLGALQEIKKKGKRIFMVIKGESIDVEGHYIDF